MKSLVIYATRTGNTHDIAEAIAAGLRPLGPVQVLSVDEVNEQAVEDADLVVVGGPTEGHRMTEPVAQFFNRTPPHALEGKAATAFDTRIRIPRWLSGSAATGIEKRLQKAGATVVVPRESFFVSKEPLLLPDEAARATAWAARLAAATVATMPAPAR